MVNVVDYVTDNDLHLLRTVLRITNLEFPMILGHRLGIKSLTLIMAVMLAGCGKNMTPAEHIAKAKDGLDAGNLSVAKIELSNALQQDPNVLEARWMLGKVLLELGDGAGSRTAPESDVIWATSVPARVPVNVIVTVAGSGPSVTVTLPAPMVDSDSSAVWMSAADAVGVRAAVVCPPNVSVKSTAAVPEIVCTSLTAGTTGIAAVPWVGVVTVAPVIGLAPATSSSWATLVAARAPWNVIVSSAGSGPPVTLTSPLAMLGSASSAVRTAAADAFVGSVDVT